MHLFQQHLSPSVSVLVAAMRNGWPVACFVSAVSSFMPLDPSASGQSKINRFAYIKANRNPIISLHRQLTASMQPRHSCQFQLLQPARPRLWCGRPLENSDILTLQSRSLSSCQHPLAPACPTSFRGSMRSLSVIA